MKAVILTSIIGIFALSCNRPEDMHNIFLKNRTVFRRIESPVKTDKKYVFEKNDVAVEHSVFDSMYLQNVAHVFEATGFNIIYTVDGDVFAGTKKKLSGLFFTSKGLNDTIELLNFRGTLKFLLKNGETKTTPFAVKIDFNWYVVTDMESF